MQEDVAPVAKNIVDKHIQEDILDTYSPAGYELGGYSRRGEGGLEDFSNTIAEMINKNTLRITNIAPPSPPIFDDSSAGEYPDELLFWIEEGLVPNYFNNNDYPWMHPRPAIDNAQKEINNSPEIHNAIQKGIDRIFGK